MDTNLNKLNVIHQINYHVIPFAYGINYEDAQRLLMSKCERKEWRIADLGDANLLKHINNLISDKNEEVSTIGRRYLIEQKGRGTLGLQNNQEYVYAFKVDKEKEYDVKIKSIELYLFETQIGFVALNFEYSKNIETIINVNYKMRHLSIKDNRLSYRIKKSKEDEGIIRELCIAELIYKITAELKVKTFFENNDGAMVHKSLVYNTAILEEPLESAKISNYLYKMRRVFKDTYKPAPAELQIENNQQILQLFENIYWGVSLEAMSCIGHLVKDENTNVFFNGDYTNRLTNSYFYLYLIILHMRYSLLYFSVISSELPKDIKECIKLENSQDKDTLSISKLEEKTAFFKLRCVFRDVSNVTHQGALYELIWRVYNIEKLLQELDSEISALALRTRLRKDEEEKQSKAIEEKKKKEQQRKDDLFKDRLTIITITFTILSALANVNKIAETIRTVLSSNGRKLEFWIFIIVLVVILMFFSLYMRYTKSKGKA